LRVGFEFRANKTPQILRDRQGEGAAAFILESKHPRPGRQSEKVNRFTTIRRNRKFNRQVRRGKWLVIEHDRKIPRV